MTSFPASQTIFTRISDSLEKGRIFQDLANSRGEVVAKKPTPESDVFLVLASHFADPQLHCKPTGPLPSWPPQGELIVTFFVGGEKYFTQSSYEFIDQQVVLNCENPLYHLQRREDYRVRIPPSYRALFEIVSINGKMDKRSLLILDLSGGGCRLQIDPKVLTLKMSDQLKGHLFLPDRDPIPVMGSIRHVKNEDHGKGPTTYGIQFVGLNEPVKNRIVAVVMDLYRQLFAGRQS